MCAPRHVHLLTCPYADMFLPQHIHTLTCLYSEMSLPWPVCTLPFSWPVMFVPGHVCTPPCLYPANFVLHYVRTATCLYLDRFVPDMFSHNIIQPLPTPPNLTQTSQILTQHQQTSPNPTQNLPNLISGYEQIICNYFLCGGLQTYGCTPSLIYVYRFGSGQIQADFPLSVSVNLEQQFNLRSSNLNKNRFFLNLWQVFN